MPSDRLVYRSRFLPSPTYPLPTLPIKRVFDVWERRAFIGIRIRYRRPFSFRDASGLATVAETLAYALPLDPCVSRSVSAVSSFMRFVPERENVYCFRNGRNKRNPTTRRRKLFEKKKTGRPNRTTAGYALLRRRRISPLLLQPLFSSPKILRRPKPDLENKTSSRRYGRKREVDDLFVRAGGILNRKITLRRFHFHGYFMCIHFDREHPNNR